MAAVTRTGSRVPAVGMPRRRWSVILLLGVSDEERRKEPTAVRRGWRSMTDRVEERRTEMEAVHRRIEMEEVRRRTEMEEVHRKTEMEVVHRRIGLAVVRCSRNRNWEADLGNRTC